MFRLCEENQTSCIPSVDSVTVGVNPARPIKIILNDNLLIFNFSHCSFGPQNLIKPLITCEIITSQEPHLTPKGLAVHNDYIQEGYRV